MRLTVWPRSERFWHRRSHCVDLPARSRPSMTMRAPRLPTDISSAMRKLSPIEQGSSGFQAPFNVLAVYSY